MTNTYLLSYSTASHITVIGPQTYMKLLLKRITKKSACLCVCVSVCISWLVESRTGGH